MVHKYSILQLNDTDDSIVRSKMFMPYDLIKDKFNICDYDNVYEGTIEGDNDIVMLEELFEIFNIRHPEDFHGHSLSTSDLVKLDDSIWYCDSFGWKAINK